MAVLVIESLLYPLTHVVKKWGEFCYGLSNSVNEVSVFITQVRTIIGQICKIIGCDGQIVTVTLLLSLIFLIFLPIT